ncbi:MAG: DsrE family protein [Gammaproteobacteria bacterium]|nr:DsrE family protein [Gammaproteobacteria bacterium]MDX2488038.1 DsrE family protein [Gammaproteobacteria bacterium]
MTNMSKKLSLVLLMSLFLFGSAFAAENSAHKKLVIQVSTDDPRTQKIALNNAVNIQKLYGIDNVTVEIVAYGPGIGLLTKKNAQADRVASLAMQDITFSACMNTMKKIEKKKGKMPALTDGVQTVTAGVARIMELQEDGYSYIRP